MKKEWKQVNVNKLLAGKAMHVAIPLFAILLGLLVGAIVMVITGHNPIEAYGALVAGIFGSSYYFGEMIRTMTPLILGGLAVAFAYRTGLFNIGVEGQLIVGWLASVYVGAAFEAPMAIHLPLSIAAAAVAGALWALVPGILKAKLHVHEVIVSIMMNYIALYTANAVIRTYLLIPGERTESVYPSASLASPFFQSLTEYSRLHYGFLIAVAACLFMWFFLWKTTAGYELRAVGLNANASTYAGMIVSRNIILSMAISGAFAGLAGAAEGLGTFGYMSILSGFTGVGFEGIAVALLGANTALGVFLSAFLFGGLKTGALTMNQQTDVPTELISIVIALIIFFVASSYVVRLMLLKRKKGDK